MAVQYVDPRGETATPVEPYELSVDLHGGPVTIGLLANGFPDSVAFLDQVGAALQAELGDVSLVAYDKGDASTIASDDMLDAIQGECQAVVAAYGH